MDGVCSVNAKLVQQFQDKGEELEASQKRTTVLMSQQAQLQTSMKVALMSETMPVVVAISLQHTAIVETEGATVAEPYLKYPG
jgi:hypothetical protein